MAEAIIVEEERGKREREREIEREGGES